MRMRELWERVVCRFKGHEMRVMFPAAQWSASYCVRCGLRDHTPDARSRSLLDAVSGVTLEDFAAVDQGRATRRQAAAVAEAEMRVASLMEKSS